MNRRNIKKKTKKLIKLHIKKRRNIFKNKSSYAGRHEDEHFTNMKNLLKLNQIIYSIVTHDFIEVYYKGYYKERGIIIVR